jgi:hypothetical protein
MISNSPRPSVGSTEASSEPARKPLTSKTGQQKGTPSRKWDEREERKVDTQLKKLLQTSSSHSSAWRFLCQCLKSAPASWALKIRGDVLPSLEKALSSSVERRPVDDAAAISAIDALSISTATALETSKHQRAWELLPAIAARIRICSIRDDETIDAVVALAEAAFELPRPWDMTPWSLCLATAFVNIVDEFPRRLESLSAKLMTKVAVIHTLIQCALELPTKSFDAWKVSCCPASAAVLDSKVLPRTLQGVRDSLPGPLWVLELCAVCVDASLVSNSGVVPELVLLASRSSQARVSSFRILTALAANGLGLDQMTCVEVLRALAAARGEELDSAGAFFKELGARTIQSHQELWRCDGPPAVAHFLQHCDASSRGDVLRAALLTARKIPHKSYVGLLFHHCNHGAPTHRVLALRALALLVELRDLKNLLTWWFEKAPPAAQAAAAEILAQKLSEHSADSPVTLGIDVAHCALQMCPEAASGFLKASIEAFPDDALHELLLSVPMENWIRFGSDDIWQKLLDKRDKCEELRNILKDCSSDYSVRAWTQLSQSPKALRKLANDNVECFWSLLVDGTSTSKDQIASLAYICISKMVLDAPRDMRRKVTKLGAPGILISGAHKYFQPQKSSSESYKECISMLARAISSVLNSMPTTIASDDPLQEALRRLKPQLAIMARSEHEDVAKVAIALKNKLKEVHAGSENRNLCQRCRENPKTCFACNGRGRFVCTRCNGSGAKKGSGKGKDRSAKCKTCEGRKHWPCDRCNGHGIYRDPHCRGCLGLSNPRINGPGKRPEEGMSIAPASAAELSSLKKLWTDRMGMSGDYFYGPDCSIQVVEAWKVTNPLRSWAFARKRLQLRHALGEEPDELEGFHGSAEANMLSICANGFDSGKRCGQAFGAGEYFAKNPCVSLSYCRGGGFMLVCRLCLGTQASDEELGNGDHIWVPQMKYYVIANPDQVLPLYILRFNRNKVSCPKLTHVLSQRSWSSLEQSVVRKVPENRPCSMTAATTDQLWIGYLRPDLSDKELEEDVLTFLHSHAPHVFEDHESDAVCKPCSESPLRLQIVRGKFTQAKVRLAHPIDQGDVKKLGSLTFTEGGVERTVTVDDAHGSEGQKCTRYIANYCRARNLRYVDPCRCDHGPLPSLSASYSLVPIDLGSAKGDEILSKFMSGGCFHDGNPQVVSINGIQNPTLQGLHEKYRAYLTQKNDGEEPKAVDLFHGTNNLILDEIYTHGLSPPSDFKPSDECPRSGGKGLCTSLCDNRCQFCVERHEWNRCHMFGLGIYLADLAQKSHRYVSQPQVIGNRRRYRMVVCSVLTGRTLQLEAHLAQPDSLHNVQSLRACWPGELRAKVTPVDDKTKAIQRCSTGAAASPVEQHDLLFVKGLGHRCCPGSSVFNSGYIAFHPYQCLPRYEIVYEM